MSAADTHPFFLPGGSTGCVLLHGLTGTPHEMRFLGAQLRAHGYTVNGVRLAGHATSIDDLERCTWHDWYASAEAGLMALQPHAARVVVVGISMGALLALKLAADHPDAVCGVVLLAPALVLSNPWISRLAPLLPAIMPFLGRRHRAVGKGESDIADPHARLENPSYSLIPLGALRQLALLQKEVRRQLSHVQQPVLIIHSKQDHTCPLDNVRILERALGGPVRHLLLEHSYHVVSVDIDKERVASAVAEFVGETARLSSGAALTGS